MPKALGLILALYQLELAAPTCDPSTQTSEGRRPWVQDHPSLQSKFGANLGSKDNVLQHDSALRQKAPVYVKYTCDMRREKVLSMGQSFVKE